MNQLSATANERAATPPLPDVGDLAGGKYRLVRLLGKGGMGIVFEAEHVRLRQSVAIKYLRPELIALPDAVARFEREARAISRMRGPHAARIVDVDRDDLGRPYMVMEVLRGRDLEVELRARGRLPIEEAVDWVLQACAAIAQAHAAGIVHRDLKPSNLFLASEGDALVLKVLDFGISKLARDDPEPTTTSDCVGTPIYMAPEQLRSSRDVDARADIWSLGVILYELIVGMPPFSGTTTAAIAAIVADAIPRPRLAQPDVPEGLERVILAALAKDPADRFPTADALAAALTAYASKEGVRGPFSLRPTEEAFHVASATMARTQHGSLEHVSSSGLSSSAVRDRRSPRARWDGFRAFAGSMAIGFGLATAVTLGRGPAASGAQVASRSKTGSATITMGELSRADAEPRLEMVDTSAAMTAPSHDAAIRPYITPTSASASPALSRSALFSSPLSASKDPARGRVVAER